MFKVIFLFICFTSLFVLPLVAEEISPSPSPTPRPTQHITIEIEEVVIPLEIDTIGGIKVRFPDGTEGVYTFDEELADSEEEMTEEGVLTLIQKIYKYIYFMNTLTVEILQPVDVNVINDVNVNVLPQPLRATHLRSVNRLNKDIPFVPSISELDWIPNMVSRVGNFEGVFYGWHDLDLETVYPNISISPIIVNNYSINSLVSSKVGENFRHDYGTLPNLNTREIDILGRDILLVAEHFQPSSSFQLRSSHSTGNSQILQGTSNFTPPTSYGANNHYLAQTWLDVNNPVRLFQLIQMMYKTMEEYEYEIQIIPIARIGNYPISQFPGFIVDDSHFWSDVYVSRTNVSKYIEKAQKDGLVNYTDNASYLSDWISVPYNNENFSGSLSLSNYTLHHEMSIDDLDASMSLAEFAVYLKRMMLRFGEPVINDIEHKQLLTMYGTYIPWHINGEQRNALEYLIVRGILDPTKCEATGNAIIDYQSRNVTVQECLLYLSRVKDVNSRLTFKTISLSFNENLISSGWGLTSINSENTPLVSDIVTTVPLSMLSTRVRDVLILIDENTEFHSFLEPELNLVNTLINPTIQSNPNSTNSQDRVPSTRYRGIFVDDSHEPERRYYHFTIFVENDEIQNSLFSQFLIDRKDDFNIYPYGYFFQINTEYLLDNPGAILIPWDSLSRGGVFSHTMSVYDTYPNSGRILYSITDNGTSFDSHFGIGVHSHLWDNSRNSSLYNEQRSISTIFADGSNYNSSISFTVESDSLSSHYWGNNSLSVWLNGGVSESNSGNVLSISQNSVEDTDLTSITVTFKSNITNPLQQFASNFFANMNSNENNSLSFPAYVTEGGNTLVSFDYLRSRGFFDVGARIDPKGEFEATTDIFSFYGKNSQTYVYLGFGKDRNVTRVISGNCIFDYVNELSPMVVWDETTPNNFYIDWRIIRGASTRGLTFRSGSGINQLHSFPIQFTEDTGLESLYISPLHGSSYSEKIRIQNKRNSSDNSPPMLLLESHNIFANYILYQKINSSILDSAILYVFKPNAPGLPTVIENTSNHLSFLGITPSTAERIHSINLTENDIMYVSYNTGLINRISNSNFDIEVSSIPRFSIGDYGWQMLLNESNALPTNWSFYNYISNNTPEYPIPIFLYEHQSGNFYSRELIDYNINIININSDEILIPFNYSLFPGAAISNFVTFSRNIYGNSLTSLLQEITPQLSHELTNSRVFPAPVGVISRAYPFQQFHTWSPSIGSTRIREYFYGSQRILHDRVVNDDSGHNLYVNLGRPGLIHSIQFVPDGSSFDSFKSISTKIDSDIFLLDSSDYSWSTLYGHSTYIPTIPDLDVSENSVNSEKANLSNFENLRLFDRVNNIITFLIFLVLYLLPHIALLQIMLFTGLVWISNYKLTILFCTHVFDVYKVLSFGRVNVHTVKPTASTIALFFAVVVLYMIQLGVGLDLLAYFTGIILTLIGG